MAEAAKKATAKKAAPKRKTLTVTERIEQARARVAELEAQEQTRNAKALTELRVQRDKLVARRDELNDKITVVDNSIAVREATSDKAEVKDAKDTADAKATAEAEIADAQSESAPHESTSFHTSSKK